LFTINHVTIFLAVHVTNYILTAVNHSFSAHCLPTYNSFTNSVTDLSFTKS